jgi:hypothetical protein
MPDRKNITNREQDQLEEATFEGGVPVHAGDGETKVIVKDLGAAARTANSGTDIRNNAGVVLPHDDKPGRFQGDTQGRP